MGYIRILPSKLANQIAAGEVVERPFSVVKELVENALDAGATSIEVTVRNGGKERIEVRDNGIGMDQQDARSSLQRFSTSKIASEEDLFTIQTYGFRGEALPSIASVSLFTLRTRSADSDSGVELLVKGGEQMHQHEIGMEQGTHVMVDQLFFNIPARMKYLKTDSTEFSHIIQYMIEIALVHYEKGFQLIHNEKVVLCCKPQKEMMGRLYELFGEQIEQELIPVDFGYDDMSLRGYISLPRYGRSSSKYEFLYINRRPIRNGMIHKAIMEGYKHTIEKGKFPFFLLNLSLSPGAVDVNVHPRKLEVRFEQTNNIFRFFQSAVTQTLEQFTTKKYSMGLIEDKINEQKNSTTGHLGIPVSSRSPYRAWIPIPEQTSFTVPQENDGEAAGMDSSSVRATPPVIRRVLGQLHRSYILFETEKGFGIADQHAAHEIVLFEEIKTLYAKQEKVSQVLLAPDAFDLSPQQMQRVQEHTSVLLSLGYDIQIVGKHSIAIHSVPMHITAIHSKELILELLEQIQENDVLEHRGRLDAIYATMACRAAVKFGDELASSEQERLLQRLSELPLGYSCPHGRPVLQEFSLQDMLKWFKR